MNNDDVDKLANKLINSDDLRVVYEGDSHNVAFAIGFEEALKLVLGNDMITEIPNCNTVEELMNWLNINYSKG